MKAVTVVMGIVILLATSVLPHAATAQRGRRGLPGGGSQGGTPAAPTGSTGGTSQGGSTAPGGYPPPGAYQAPAGPSSGYPPPGSASPGYPAPSSPSPSQPPFAYPQRGQSPQQVTTDQNECATWATQQTGFNPSASATAAPVTATSAGESAGLFGGAKRREKRRGESGSGQQEPAAASAPNPQQVDAYHRALDACLTTRGYTVR